MAFLGLNKSQKKQLEYEVVPYSAKLQLTRLLRAWIESADNTNDWVIRANSIVNICRNVMKLPVSLVEVNEWGDYEYYDAGWLRSEIEVAMRRPDTIELIETLADLIQADWVGIDEVNDILSDNGVAVSFEKDERSVKVRIISLEDIEDEDDDVEIPNIRHLIQRMETALESSDFPGVLHSSASVFETLAKDVFQNPNVDDKSLGSFFEGYRKASRLPAPVLDYIKAVYDRRNTEPLAGHGQVSTPSITQEEAIVLSEMTKAFVKIERKLGLASISPPKAKS
jgi:hypothetical protein